MLNLCRTPAVRQRSDTELARCGCGDCFAEMAQRSSGWREVLVRSFGRYGTVPERDLRDETLPALWEAWRSWSVRPDASRADAFEGYWRVAVTNSLRRQLAGTKRWVRLANTVALRLDAPYAGDPVLTLGDTIPGRSPDPYERVAFLETLREYASGEWQPDTVARLLDAIGDDWRSPEGDPAAQLADALTAAIERGELTGLLPGVRTMAGALDGATRAAIGTAYEILQDRGLVDGARGRRGLTVRECVR